MAVELDYMEYADDAAAQAAYVSSDFNPGSWDILNEDCSNIGDWNDQDVGDGESSVSPAGQFRFDSGTAGAGNYAYRNQDIGSFPNTFTVEVKVYHDSLGDRGNTDSFILTCSQGDERFRAFFAADGLFINDTDSGFTEIWTNLVKTNGSAEWQTWRFLVTFGSVGDGVCDVYLKDSTHNWEKVGTAIPCSTEGAATNGLILLLQYGHTSANMITHMDYLKMFEGLQAPNLQCFSESTIKEQGSYALKIEAIQTDSLNDTLTRTIA